MDDEIRTRLAPTLLDPAVARSFPAWRRPAPIVLEANVAIV